MRFPTTVRLLTGLLLIAVATPGHAAKLVGIVSERSAPALAAAAEAFDQEHPGHELILRTPEQDDSRANGLPRSKSPMRPTKTMRCAIRITRAAVAHS